MDDAINHSQNSQNDIENLISRREFLHEEIRSEESAASDHEEMI
jgi:hypothetical protein